MEQNHDPEAEKRTGQASDFMCLQCNCLMLYSYCVGDDQSPTHTVSESIIEQSLDPQREEETGQVLDLLVSNVRLYNVLIFTMCRCCSTSYSLCTCVHHGTNL